MTQHPDDLGPPGWHRHDPEEAKQIVEEYLTMNMPLEITEAVIGYLQSWEFLFLVCLFVGYKAFKNVLR